MGRTKNASRDFFCETCKQGDGKGMDLSEMKKHLLIIHKIDVTKTKGTEEMLFHLDGTDFYQSNYKLTFDGVEMTEVSWNPRSKADKALW
jgi:hypothetical protein